MAPALLGISGTHAPDERSRRHFPSNCKSFSGMARSGLVSSVSAGAPAGFQAQALQSPFRPPDGATP
jgi:hypothetical protein